MLLTGVILIPVDKNLIDFIFAGAGDDERVGFRAADRRDMTVIRRIGGRGNDIRFEFQRLEPRDRSLDRKSVV